MSAPTPVPDWAWRAAIEHYASPKGSSLGLNREKLAHSIADHWARETQVLRCAYCSQPYPPGTPESQHELLNAHIRVCTKHPMREVEAKVTRYEEALRSIADHDSGAWAAGHHRGDAFEAAYVRVCTMAYEALNPPTTP